MYLRTLLDDFERSLRRRDLSFNTIEAYHWALHDLTAKTMARTWLFEVDELTRDVLEEWQDSQLTRGWTARSRGLAVTSARQFIRYGVDKEIILDTKLERALAKVKQPDMEAHPIPEEDLAIIRAYLLPLMSDTTAEQLRDRALFVYLLVTGARVSEVLQVRRDDYEAPNVLQKGRTRKTLRVPAEAAELVRDYLCVRDDNRPELWISYKTRSLYELMTPSQVRKIWRDLASFLGLTYWTTHGIRHTCATLLLEAGVSEIVAADHLGHHGTATIHGYSKVRDKSRQKVLTVMGGFAQLPELLEAS